MTGIDLPPAAGPLPAAQVAELTSLAARGEAHPDPTVRRHAVVYARERGVEARRTLALFGLLVPATLAATFFLYTAVGDAVPAWALAALALSSAATAVAMVLSIRPRLRAFDAIENANLRALLDAAAPGPPVPLTVRYDAWAEALALVGVRGDGLRPPVTVGPAGVAAPASGVRLAWAEVGPVELLPPAPGAPRGRIAWRADVFVDVHRVRQPPEAVVLSSRGYL